MVRMCNDLASYLPEQNEVLKHCEGNVETINEPVAEEQDEVLVV